jgi:hypothetical protein
LFQGIMLYNAKYKQTLTRRIEIKNKVREKSFEE